MLHGAITTTNVLWMATGAGAAVFALAMVGRIIKNCAPIGRVQRPLPQAKMAGWAALAHIGITLIAVNSGHGYSVWSLVGINVCTLLLEIGSVRLTRIPRVGHNMPVRALSINTLIICAGIAVGAISIAVL